MHVIRITIRDTGLSRTRRDLLPGCTPSLAALVPQSWLGVLLVDP